jgi:hypothetical protein
MVCSNPQLHGVIDPEFLAKCEECSVAYMTRIDTPFISGASLSSFDIPTIFRYAPKVVVALERLQGAVSKIGRDHPDYATFTAHLPDHLAAVNKSWCMWQKVWVDELRSLENGSLFIFCTSWTPAAFWSLRGRGGGGSTGTASYLLAEMAVVPSQISAECVFDKAIYF